MYRNLAGTLQYFTYTHPNIGYVQFNRSCLYMHSPREPYILMLKGILRVPFSYGFYPHPSYVDRLVSYIDAN